MSSISSSPQEEVGQSHSWMRHPDQVFMNHLTNELRRCVREDGDRSDASRLYTLYALDKKKEITNPQTLLDDLALRGHLKNACRSADFAEDGADF